MTDRPDPLLTLDDEWEGESSPAQGHTPPVRPKPAEDVGPSPTADAAAASAEPAPPPAAKPPRPAPPPLPAPRPTAPPVRGGARTAAEPQDAPSIEASEARSIDASEARSIEASDARSIEAADSPSFDAARPSEDSAARRPSEDSAARRPSEDSAGRASEESAGARSADRAAAWYAGLLDAPVTRDSDTGSQRIGSRSDRDSTGSQQTGSRPEHSAEQTGPRRQAAVERLARSVCAFWLGGRCFGLEVDLVREVVSVDSVIPVPLAPRAIFGLFNLRGTPVPLVDLTTILELTDGSRPSDSAFTALVLDARGMVAALSIQQMEGVLSAGDNPWTAAHTATDAPFVKGFIELAQPAGLVVTVLDSDAVIGRLERLKFT